METRLTEHQDPRKPIAVTDHLLRNNHDTSIYYVRFIASGKKNDKGLLIKESLLVKKLNPILNGNVSSRAFLILIFILFIFFLLLPLITFYHHLFYLVYIFFFLAI